MKRFGILIVPALSGVAMQAQAITGNQLYETCRHYNPPHTNEAGSYCRGYVAGVIETLPPELSKYTCLPDGIDANRLTLVVRDYLADNREKLQEEASILVNWALINSFPCRDIPPE